MGHSRRVSVKNDQINLWVAENIRELMDAKGLNQPLLAKRADVAQKTVSNFLRPAQRKDSSKGREPSGTLTNLGKIANALEVPAWQLTRPTNKAERELYTRIEEAYRTLLESARAQQAQQPEQAEPPDTVQATKPTEKQRKLAESKRLRDLSDIDASNHGGKAS